MNKSWLPLIAVLFVSALPCLAATSDPLAGTTYRFEITGLAEGYAPEVSNIGSTQEIIEVKTIDGSGRELVRKVPGRLKWNDVTITRALTPNMDLSNWRKLVVDEKIAEARVAVRITMLDSSFREVAAWEFTNAWPSSLTYERKSDGSVVETLVFTHEGLVRR